MPPPPQDLRPIQIMTFSVQLNEKKNSEWKTYFDLVPYPDLEIRGRGGAVIQTLRKKGGRSPKRFFSALRVSVWSKNKGTGGGLSWIRHCDQHCYRLFPIRAFSIPFLSGPWAYKLQVVYSMGIHQRLWSWIESLLCLFFRWTLMG